MLFFLAFLVLTTVFVPMVTLSQWGRFTLALVFALTILFGACATIHQRPVKYLVAGLAVLALVVELIAEFAPGHGALVLNTLLKLTCLAILVFMTLNQTLRPGPVTVYRVIGGIAGYLLIGMTWTYAYQLVIEQEPGAIHF